MERINPFDAIFKSMTRKSTKCMNETPLEFPKELHVELTNRCNLRCPFCPVGNAKQSGLATGVSMKRQAGFMREDLFWAICTEAKEYGAAIRLIRFGEPTLHPRVYDYIRMAKSIGLLVHMNTNGVNLDVKEVIASGLDSIKVSVHNHLALKSMGKLFKQRGDAEKPFITVGMLNPEGGTYNIPEGVDNNNVGEVKDLQEGGRAPKTCYELYNRLSIDWDGRVVACCGSYDRQMLLGKVYKQTLKEVWDGKKLQTYRALEQKHRLDLVPLCNHCAR